MPENKKLKRMARDLSIQIGVSYQAALQQLRGDLGGPSRPATRAYTTPGRVYLRPFETVLVDPQHPPVAIAASIVEGDMVVEVMGQTVVLKAIELGQDYRGPFVAVNEQVHSLADGFELRVDVEVEQDSIAMCGIVEIVREGPERQMLKAEVAARGIDGILVHPYDRHYAMYFECEGTPEARFRQTA